MKKIALTLLPVLLCACSGGYTISGTAPEGTDSVFLSISDTALILKDTALVSSDGSYSFKGKVNEISSATVLIKNKAARPLYAQFALNNEKVTLKLDSTGFIAVESSITATKVNQILEQLYAAETSEEESVIMDSVLITDPHLAPYLMGNVFVYSVSIPQYDSFFAKLDDSMKNSPYIVKSSNFIDIMRKTDIGQKFTDFVCPAADGQPIQLSSLAGNGKWVLVDFWASWCRPCRRENPNVVAAYTKFHDKGFEVLGVSLDKDSTAWQNAVAKDSLVWTQVSELKGWNSPSGKLYGIISIPANVMINPEGTIVARNLRGEALEKFLSENIQ